jgi:hypothetical protein
MRHLISRNQNLKSNVTPKSHSLFYLLLAGFSLVWFLQSCSKAPITIKHEVKKLCLSFQAGSIPMNSIDSAFVLLRRDGVNTNYFLRFDQYERGLQVNIDGFRPGQWIAELYVYTKMNLDGKSKLYFQSKIFDILNNSTKVEFIAPRRINNDSWKKRVIFSNAGNDISVLVSLDHADPYIGAVAKNKSWDYIFIQRYAYQNSGGSQVLIASAAWECDGDCFGSNRVFNNTSAFATFSEKIKSADWNTGKIKVIVANYQSGEDFTMLYTYNK